MFTIGAFDGGAGSFLGIFLIGIVIEPLYIWYWLHYVRKGGRVFIAGLAILFVGYLWMALLLAIAAGKTG